VTRSHSTRLALFAAFAGTVIAANWALGRYGVVPIGLGLQAPAGVFAAGAAFGLRDALHETSDHRWVLAAIATGAALSYAIEDAATIPGGAAPIAAASAAAFLLSEMADLAVYTPLRGRSWPAAVALSNLVGAVIDSALFLWLAFGDLGHLPGNVIGKYAMTAVALPVVWKARAVSRDRVRPAGA
jgi:uncharacterized PurR-regulated membrane protein YhhQ (DUF165 family)